MDNEHGGITGGDRSGGEPRGATSATLELIVWALAEGRYTVHRIFRGSAWEWTHPDGRMYPPTWQVPADGSDLPVASDELLRRWAKERAAPST